jgi:hypothetical protein
MVTASLFLPGSLFPRRAPENPVLTKRRTEKKNCRAARPPPSPRHVAMVWIRRACEPLGLVQSRRNRARVAVASVPVEARLREFPVVTVSIAAPRPAWNRDGKLRFAAPDGPGRGNKGKATETVGFSQLSAFRCLVGARWRAKKPTRSAAARINCSPKSYNADSCKPARPLDLRRACRVVGAQDRGRAECARR